MPDQPDSPSPQSTRVDWDRKFITERAYGTDDKLATRQSIYAFSKPTGEPGFFGWGVSRISWGGAEIVLDVGCGNGMWPKRLAHAMSGLRTVGADLSEGMLRSFVAKWEGSNPALVAVADAQELPFETGRWTWLSSYRCSTTCPAGPELWRRHGASCGTTARRWSRHPGHDS